MTRREPSVAIVHDYLTQRGGAERVVLSMVKALNAPVYTSLYEPDATFPEFRHLDVRTAPINRVGFLRERHRLAFPLFAPTFASLHIDADVVLCSSSGWAHGVRTRAAKLVYCHSPAKWLYAASRYLGDRRPVLDRTLKATRPLLRGWDQRAVRSAATYVANSTATRERIRDLYGIEATVIPPASSLDPGGALRPVAGVDEGFFLCVARLLPYKNVDATMAAFDALPQHRLVIVGTGPEEERLRAAAGPNIRLLGVVGDDELRWLYANACGLVSAAYEDFGLTVIEAAAFGTPAIALRAGGFIDTVVPGVTGLFFDLPEASPIASAVAEAASREWDREFIRAHAEPFGEARFIELIRRVVQDAARLHGHSMNGHSTNGHPIPRSNLLGVE